MKSVFGILMVIGLIALNSSQALSQSYTATISPSVNGSTLNVDVYLQTTAGTSAILGDATLTITYNTAALTYQGKDAACDGRWDDASNSSYNDLFSNEVSPNASLNIIKSGSGAGLDIPFSPTRVGRIVFSILNASLSSGIAWKTSLSSIKQFNGDALTGVSFPNPDDMPLPITLSAFNAVVNPAGCGVKLEWATQSEIHNLGFLVERRAQSDTAFHEIRNSFVQGQGTTTVAHSYSFVDSTLNAAGRYEYRLNQLDLDGKVHRSPGVAVSVPVQAILEVAPIAFALLQNYPNPFNPETTIKFSVEQTSPTRVDVYDISGRLVTTLFDGIAISGRYYRLRFTGTGIASGVYFYRLQGNGKSTLHKMLLLK